MVWWQTKDEIIPNGSSIEDATTLFEDYVAGFQNLVINSQSSEEEILNAHEELARALLRLIEIQTA